MQAAQAWSVPRSVFLGRVVRPGEPLWLTEDRWWSLAKMEHDASLCRDCGQPLHESTHVDNEYAYDAAVSRCHGCAAAGRRMKAVQDGNTETAGLHVSVHRRE